VKVSDYDHLQQAPAYWGWSDPAVRLPHDGLPAEQLSGPCRTYRLGGPMTMQQLQAMPADLQRQYLRRLRRAGATAEDVGNMLGVSVQQAASLGVVFDRPDPKAWAEFCKVC